MGMVETLTDQLSSRQQDARIGRQGIQPNNERASLFLRRSAVQSSR
jgi:hypothetical protein